MQREAAGMAKEVPMMIRAAGKLSGLIANAKKRQNLQMSHHTGAQLIALPDQTIELTNWLRQANAVQNM